jgi:hypothetical protein
VLALKIINFKDNAIAGDSLTWLVHRSEPVQQHLYGGLTMAA